jgi:hypothetical protein
MVTVRQQMQVVLKEIEKMEKLKHLFLKYLSFVTNSVGMARFSRRDPSGRTRGLFYCFD